MIDAVDFRIRGGTLTGTVSMEFRILGPLEVVADGREVELGGPKQRAVLAMLALEPNRVVSVDRIVDQLWGEDPPASALGSLHAYISNMRRILEPDRTARAPATVLVSRPPGYALAVEPHQLDMLRFEQLVAEGAAEAAAGRPEQAAQALGRALDLWRGPVLADFAYETFVASAAPRLEELRRVATEDLVDARLAMGQHAAVVAQLEELVRADPLRERTWGQLIVALYRCGRQADALRAYERARSVLAEELGLVPGPELRSLEQAVLAHDPDLDWSRRAPFSGPVTAPSGRDDGEPLGRDEPLARLDDLFALLDQGRGAVVLVTGEPGVGKTTLLSAMSRRARDRGLAVGCGQSLEGGGAPPLWPWAEALRQLPLSAPPPDLAVLASAEPGAGQVNAGAVFDQAVDRLRRLAADVPVLVVLDDLQWSDELTHQLVRLVLPVVTETPVLLALGVREPVEEPSADLVATRAALARVPDLERIPLHGLDRDAVAALAARVAGEAAAADVVAAIHDRTAGNPFFVTELVRLLASEHALHDVDRMARAGVPVGARDAVRRRLARLPEQAVVVLGVASVLGPQVDIRLLASVTGIGIDELVDLLELAAVSGVVRESRDRPGVYLFTHDLVREAIYDALPGMRRARLHEQVAAALLELHGDGLATAHEVAHHAVLAVPVAGPDQAATRLVQSVRAAQLQLSFELAQRQLRLALELLAEAPPTGGRRVTQAELEGRLAQIEFLIYGRREEAAARLQRARELCAAADARTRAGMLVGQASLLMLWGDVAASVEAGDETVALGGATGDLQARSDGLYARTLALWAGDMDAARRDIDGAVTLGAEAAAGGPPAGPHVPLSVKRGLRALTYALAGETSEVAEEARAAVALAGAEGLGNWALSWTSAYVMVSAALRGDPEEALRVWAEVAERAAGIGYTDAVLDACRAWAAAARSASPDASALHEARARLAEAGDGLLTVPLALLEADLLIRAGDGNAAGHLLAGARAHAESHGHLAFLPEIDRLTVRAVRARGDGRRAAEMLRAAAAASERMGLGLFAARARGDLADLRAAPSHRLEHA